MDIYHTPYGLMGLARYPGKGQETARSDMGFAPRARSEEPTPEAVTPRMPTCRKACRGCHRTDKRHS